MGENVAQMQRNHSKAPSRERECFLKFILSRNVTTVLDNLERITQRIKLISSVTSHVLGSRRHKRHFDKSPTLKKSFQANLMAACC